MDKKEFLKQHNLNKARMKRFLENTLSKAEGTELEFKDTTSVVDAVLQDIAERTANPYLLENIKQVADNIRTSGGVSKLELSSGTLTLSGKDHGLYNAMFSDLNGQVVEEFQSTTPAIIAKVLEIKQLAGPMDLAPPELELVEQGPTDEEQIVEESDETPSYVRIKFGDFEFELKKSIHDFIKNYKNEKQDSEVRKALNNWKRNSKIFNRDSDLDTAKFLRDNWEEYLEDFKQTVSVMRMNKK